MKLREFIAAGLACAALTLPSAALTLEVDGVDRTRQAKAVLMEDRTWVSLRSVSTMLDPDAQVGWWDGCAYVTGEGYLLSARPGEGYIKLNDTYFSLGGTVRNENGTVMVPLRTLCAALGGSVGWDNRTATAILGTGTASAETAQPEQTEPSVVTEESSEVTEPSVVTEPSEATQPSETTGTAAYDEQDLYWLSRIISAESRGEPLKGKIAVGTVVLNRVKSDEFPNTIYDVIFDQRWGGQFEPVRNGTVYNEPTEESVLAAKMCLDGAREAGDSLYFLAPDLTSNHWAMENCTYVTTIGCHWFYR